MAVGMKNLWRLAMLACMNRPLACLVPAVLALALSACSTVVVEPASGAPTNAVASHGAVPGGYYDVVKGDTLYAIAFRKGVDFRDLAKWNNIAAPYTIWPGQRLRLAPTAGAAPAAPGASHPATASVATVPAKGAAPGAPAAPVFEDVPASAPTQSQSQSAPSPGAKAPTTIAQAPSPAAGTHAAAPAPAASTVVPVAGEPKPATPPPAPAPAVAGGSARNAGGVTWRWPASGDIITRFTPGDAVPGIEIAGKAGDPVRAAADGVVVYSGNGLVGYGELVIIKHSDSLLSAYGHNSKRLVKEGQRVTAGQEIALMGSSGAARVELGFQIRKDGNPVDPLSYLPAR